MTGTDFDVVILGAGAAGMMCAIEAAKRDRRVVVVDHAEAPGEKIRISGGGRCNFTNLHAAPRNFISENPQFCTSALSRYTQHDFIKLVEKHGIGWHEKTLGQLFCDVSSRDIINLLLSEMDKAGALLQLETAVQGVTQRAAGADQTTGIFDIATSRGDVTAKAVVVATGGLSIPKMGATGIGYDIARHFGHNIIPTRAALVPLLFDPALLALTKPLSGLSVDPARVACGKTAFDEALLFTHRGLSGPSILQISSYWREGLSVSLDLLPGRDALALLKDLRKTHARQKPHNALGTLVPARLAEMICQQAGADGVMADLPDRKLQAIAALLQRWEVVPTGSEGYRTAEVTAGGVDTRDLSSKTMESRTTPGLYFIGEVVDVTGWLGGYNFQWAWSSGWVAGQFA